MRRSPPFETATQRIDWRTVGPFQTNSYLLLCKKTGEAAIIDACDEADELLAMIEAHKAKVVWLLQTHGHLDHVAALDDLKKATGAPIVLHAAEVPLYEQVEMQYRLFGLPPRPSPPPPDRFVVEGETLQVGELSIRVLETPGHTPGGISFLAEQTLFSGDTLFQSSIGRSDLPGGDHRVLMRSLQRLVRLDPATEVFPGHGPPTTIEREARFNPFL